MNPVEPLDLSDVHYGMPTPVYSPAPFPARTLVDLYAVRVLVRRLYTVKLLCKL